jgi:hypothetical protein
MEGEAVVGNVVAVGGILLQYLKGDVGDLGIARNLVLKSLCVPELQERLQVHCGTVYFHNVGQEFLVFH